MESWRMVWREGFAPGLTLGHLVALAAALGSDDQRLIQGATTRPEPLLCMQDWPCEGACAVAFCGWQGEGLETVGEVDNFFFSACIEADKRLGEPGACRWFLNWFDLTPRDEMRKLLLEEVRRTQAERFGVGEVDHVPA